jgi:mono/diheme cytochrome c family protein
MSRPGTAAESGRSLFLRVKEHAAAVLLASAILRNLVMLLVGSLGVVMGVATAQVPVEERAPVGVTNPQRAWQNWTLNCQGCHRPDGAGSDGTAPPLAGTVSKFLTVPGGREYLGRVPGVATSPLENADLADLMNWMFWRFDKEHLPANFVPFTAEELGRWRSQPLRLEAAQMRSDLFKQADELAAR